MLRSFFIVLLFPLLWLAHPTTAQACPQANGTTQRASYRSQLAETTMYYTVYMPPVTIPQTQMYPTLHPMHVLDNEDDGHWTCLGIIAALDEGFAPGNAPAHVGCHALWRVDR